VSRSDAGTERNILVVLHPDRPLVLDPIEVFANDPPPGWPELLGEVRQAVPAGAWPLGPGREVPGLRIHVAVARGTATAADRRWTRHLDRQWPQAVHQVVAAAWDEDADRALPHPRRAPWMRRGWWTEVSAWVDARLAEVGQRKTGDLEPKEHWGISAVALVPTSGGSMWLKAVPPIFAREPAVLRLIDERLPGRVPAVVAADATAVETRVLLTEAGPVPAEVNAHDLPRLAALLADVQVRSLDLLPRLAAAGCADHSPTQLAAELARMAEEGVELDRLDPQERAALQRLVPELTNRLLALSVGPLPTVLVHGDFHPWNVARPPSWKDSDAVIIDWTDAGVGPAGVDLATLFPETADEAARREVRRAYADVFATHLGIPLSVADAAVEATEVAGHVIQALAYDVILRGIEPAAAGLLSGAMAGRLRALLT